MKYASFLENLLYNFDESPLKYEIFYKQLFSSNAHDACSFLKSLENVMFTRSLTEPSLNLRPQKPRTIFTQEQLALLEQIYQDSNYPSSEKRQMLAKVLDLTDERVRVWFQNRRAKEKRLAEEKLALSLRPSKREVSVIYKRHDEKRSAKNLDLQVL